MQIEIQDKRRKSKRKRVGTRESCFNDAFFIACSSHIRTYSISFESMSKRGAETQSGQDESMQGVLGVRFAMLPVLYSVQLPLHLLSLLSRIRSAYVSAHSLSWSTFMTCETTDRSVHDIVSHWLPHSCFSLTSSFQIPSHVSTTLSLQTRLDLHILSSVQWWKTTPRWMESVFFCVHFALSHSESVLVSP